ncbi:SPOR domain-containing protein [Nonomuraea antimicrobica]
MRIKDVHAPQHPLRRRGGRDPAGRERARGGGHPAGLVLRRAAAAERPAGDLDRGAGRDADHHVARGQGRRRLLDRTRLPARHARRAAQHGRHRAGGQEIADRVAGVAREKGFEPRIEEVTAPAYADRPAGTLGWTVRVGRYATSAEASAALSKLRAAGFAGGTRYTAQDGTDPGAPQKVHVLRVDFREFGGTVGTDFGATLNGTEKLTDLAAAAGAVAGINAQWFYNSAPGGMYVKDGKLIGSATQGRGGIKITKGGRSVDVDAYTAHVTLRAGRENVEIDGVNRVPGEIYNCGGVGGDQPTEKPQHDLKCTDDSELVLFTPNGAPRRPARAPRRCWTRAAR